MDDVRIARGSGGLALVGGLAWVAASVIHASQPRGCVGEECTTLSMREATTATSLLIAAAGLAMVVSGAGLLTLVRRQGELAVAGRLGAVVCGAGVVLLTVAVTLNGLFYDGDFSWMPAFVVPGVAALAVGLVLVGWAVLRSGIVPTWLGVAILAGALLLLGTNEQTAAVLLAVPFGLAWAATGLLLLVRRPSGAVGDRADRRTSALVGE